MDAAFTEEQEEIRRTLRDLLAKRCGTDDVKAAVRTPAGYDTALWRSLAHRLGLPGLAVAQEYGGVGCGPTELALACEETGRALLPSPLLATAVLAAPLVAALGSPAQRAALLPRMADGTLTATLVVSGATLPEVLGLTGPRPEDWAGGGRAGGVQARRTADGWRLYGQADRVLDGHSAGLLLVAARTGGYTRGRTSLFAVRAGTPGLVRVRRTALDETRAQARVELRNVAAEPLGAAGAEAADGTAPAAALARLGGAAGAALAAEAVGAADRVLARTVEYVRARRQFGRAIGSFQAVQHRLADLYVQVEAARSAAYYAAWSGTGPAGGLALAQALEALRAVAAEAVQLHGGIGFTWEHDAHLFFKRAASDELLFGPVHRLRARAAERAGLFAAGHGGDEDRTAMVVV
ncbi:acyl-CoA dehydrogenase family protein [Streptomyces sp. XD-27]|uniref:acyl-CoA dehydrogenase family protein n=1 Tax=Streptomyces sp. XD-27 TaxID=3062779 RepID=UPI0026F41204|nr:acyl-CoA dehydrogenase family protein [Streptomyces sp. XD-27]WKX72088.1 acyl-CoA dehydrogenase family protein [Streptomyces sp. XD-27]